MADSPIIDALCQPGSLARRSRLVPGGIIAIGDQTLHADRLTHLAYQLQRLPVVVPTLLLTQTTTNPSPILSSSFHEA